MASNEDQRIEKQVAQKEADDEAKRLGKEAAKARWEADIQKSRVQQIARKQAEREQQKSEDAETAKFLHEWCKVLDRQEQEEVELKNQANRKLSLEHRKMVEISRRKGEQDKGQEGEVSLKAK